MSVQKSLVESKGEKKHVTLFEDYYCKECGSSKILVFESNNSICLKCKECNDNVIYEKQSALEELKSLIYICKSTCDERFISIEVIKNRIRELQVEK